MLQWLLKKMNNGEIRILSISCPTPPYPTFCTPIPIPQLIPKSCDEYTAQEVHTCKTLGNTERSPKTCVEAGEFADKYEQARLQEPGQETILTQDLRKKSTQKVPLRSNRAFDRRVLQKAFSFAAVRKRESGNNALLPLRKGRPHVMELSRKWSFTLPGAKMSESKGYKSESYWIGGRPEGEEYIAGHRLLPNHG